MARGTYMTDVVIGCDIGTQSCKAVAIDAAGQVLARATAGYQVLHPHPGWAEQDAATWEQALDQVITSVAADVGPERVAALGIAGQIDGIVAVDAKDAALAPAIIWMDRRATAETTDLANRWGAAAMRRRTGLAIDASHGAPKIAWLARARRYAREAPPDAYLLPVSYLVARLTGSRVVDPAAASSSLLLDLGTGDWADDLLDDLGMTRASMALIRPAASVAGQIRVTVADRLGVRQGVPVMVGTGDEHAACLGAGVLDPGLVCDITGTAEPVAAVATTPEVDPTGLLETHPHAVPDRWLIENPGFVSGGSTRWLADAVLGVPERDLFQLAAAAPVGADGLVFVPALGGAVTPRWNDRARGTFHGLRLGHDRRHLARAVLEGCAFALRDVVDGLEAMGLTADGRIRVVGGGARDDLWVRIKSDVTGRPMERVTEPEVTAFGAALLAAAGVGWFRDAASAARATVVPMPHVELPDPGHHAQYMDAYDRYRRIYDALEPIDMGGAVSGTGHP